MVYRTKIASGPDLGSVCTLLADNAIVPTLTASQIGMGRFFSISPVITQVSYANANGNISNNWNSINDTQWDKFAETDWNIFS